MQPGCAPNDNQARIAAMQSSGTLGNCADCGWEILLRDPLVYRDAAHKLKLRHRTRILPSRGRFPRRELLRVALLCCGEPKLGPRFVGKVLEPALNLPKQKILLTTPLGAT